MKILIVNKFLHPNGGSETYIFKLGEALTEMGEEIQYFGMDDPKRIVGNKAGVYTDPLDFHKGGLKRFLYPFRIVYSREARRKIRLVLEDMQPDAVHLNNINFQLTPAIIDEIRDFEAAHPERYALLPLQILYTAHDAQWVCPNHLMRVPDTGRLCMDCLSGNFDGCVKQRCIHSSRLRSLLGKWEAMLYRRRKTYAQVNRVICPSHFMERVLSCHPDLEGRTVALHNFIDAPAAGDLPSFDERKCVLYFGRYAEEKGVRTLLQAAKALPEIPFVFAGSGPLKSEVKGENITEKGFLTGEALRETLAHAKLMVFPSEWYENCPFSVLEAQSAGIPVLVCDLGGAPELLETRGDEATGRLFRAGDAEDLIGAIRELWADEARLRRMSENGPGFVRRHFPDVKSYARRMWSYYQGSQARVRS